MRRRLTVLGVVYPVMAAVFALVGRVGIDGVQRAGFHLGAPLLVAGVGAAIGCLVIAAAVIVLRVSIVGDAPDSSVVPRAVRLANTGRLIILAAGVACALLGAWLAPPMGDIDGDLVTGVALVCGLAWAVVALVADDVGRLVRRAALTAGARSHW